MDEYRSQSATEVADLLESTSICNQGLAIPLPDYSIPPENHLLDDILTAHNIWRIKIGSRELVGEYAFFYGALSVLKLLGEKQFTSISELNDMARQLTHECKHALR